MNPSQDMKSLLTGHRRRLLLASDEEQRFNAVLDEAWEVGVISLDDLQAFTEKLFALLETPPDEILGGSGALTMFETSCGKLRVSLGLVRNGRDYEIQTWAIR